ncbi:MAG: hypothetical protein ACXWF8_05935 [Methylobacter sp.]
MRLLNIFSLTITAVLLSTASCFAAPIDNSAKENYPTYQNGMLTIPRIDTPEKPGNFLDAIFKNEQGDWQLLSLKTANQYPLIKSISVDKSADIGC